MIETAELLPVADALKLFGDDGTLIVKFRPHALKNFRETEPVFAFMDGIPVPFFTASLQTRGNDRARILFDAIYNKTQAGELAGKTLYQVVSKDKCSKTQSNHFEKPEMLVGFTVSDRQSGLLGCVEAFIDWRMNPCLSIRHANDSGTFLVPFQDVFILNIDLKTRHIIVSLPEGLIAVQLF